MSIAMTNHESAGSNIVGTHELLENVLRFLPDKDALLAQSVSQEFKYVIETSITIRGQPHFIASGDDYKPFHPLLPRSFPEATIKPHGASYLWWHAKELQVGTRNYSWRKIQVVPASNTMPTKVGLCAMYVLETKPTRVQKYYHWYAVHLMTDNHGLSLGQLVDVLRAESSDAGVRKRVEMVFVDIFSSMKAWEEAREADEERAWPYSEYPFENPW